MPTYLDFNTTRTFRDALIVRTLQQPNGPQTFNDSNYVVQNLSDFPNIDPGAVDTNRVNDLLQIKTSNIFKPLEYFVKDTIDTIPRRANLALYYNGTPYFRSGNYSLVGIMTTTNYDNESELFKFAASYIRDKDQKGPVYSRIEQNLKRATEGRVRLLDALNGNTTTAINLITGREPLVDPNYQITVAKTLPGKGIDFLQTVAGVEFPFTEIPGDYLTNPANPVNFRPEARTEAGAIIQDVTGALGSLVGIQRRPQRDRKPSDLFIEYMGQGQKQRLFDNLSFSKYAPNYTTTARSQNSSRLFNFVDNVAQGVRNVLGVEAPAGVAYIGDDRGNDVKYAMGDFNDRPVRSNFYLTLLFDEIQARLFQRTKNIGEGGQISNNLTWISKNSRNKLGENNEYYNQQRSNLEESLSKSYDFREDSILGVTQELLNTLPTNGGEARSHVANAIDQTSRVFREGDVRISRGSAIKYTDKFSGEESGVEYCRVWTKDRPYYTMSDLMKKKGNIRKFEGSVMTAPYNLNIAPMSDGNKGFDSSTNIFPNYPYGGGFYAKKYMFSIENLAWKNSNKEGFTVQDLPYCERGPNGGRVMWFPPYDLKVSESNSARWEENSFLGRPEPIYTYQNTVRTGQISFKVIVDHPSIMNLLVREFFKNMSDEEANNYINAFFAGCQDVDLYDLVKRYTTLSESDVDLIQRYFDEGGDPEVIKKYKTTVTQPVIDGNTATPPLQPAPPGTSKSITFGAILKYDNDQPEKSTQQWLSALSYTKLYENWKPTFEDEKSLLGQATNKLIDDFSLSPNTDITKSKIALDLSKLFGSVNTSFIADKANKVQSQKDQLDKIYTKLEDDFKIYTDGLKQLKLDISGGTVQKVTLKIASSTSILNDFTKNYNMNLSFRRTASVLKDFFESITNTPISNFETFAKEKLKWSFEAISNSVNQIIDEGKPIEFSNIIKFKDLGYDIDGEVAVLVINYGENGTVSGVICNTGKFNHSAPVTTTTAIPNLFNVFAPISTECRQSNVYVEYTKNEKVIQPPTPTLPPVPAVLPKTTIEPDGEIVIQRKPKKPPIDVMKRIIMKTLAECFYFKKLEEDSPVQFSSLKEKLRYFHPAFHSMTPEGLNSRLTFLNQCVRPGDTIPIKGISDVSDLNARNTTFGPPPICIIRIGDFYHSKVAIKEVGITFDDNVWDLNPEGIGVQPMIANVSLQVSFLGGQGLEKPVERLQNALSSNFYANTEMYDERSIPTNTKIAGVDAAQFTKQFLEEIQNNPKDPQEERPGEKNSNNVSSGYIGKALDKKLSYLELIEELIKQTENYFEKYKNAYNEAVLKYGDNIASLYFSSKYRKIDKFDVFKTFNGTQKETLEFLGEYPKGRELNTYLSELNLLLTDIIEKTPSLTKDMLDIKMADVKVPISDQLLKPYFLSKVKELVNGISEFPPIKEVESVRNQIIKILDGLNYIVFYIHDGKVENDKYTRAMLAGFTSDLLYKNYDHCVEYFLKNHKKLTNKITNSIDFSNKQSITNTQAIDIIGTLLKDSKKEIMGLYVDSILFRPSVEKVKIDKALDKFLNQTKKVNFKLPKYPIKKTSSQITYGISTESEITDSTEKETIKKIKSSKLPLDKMLNYYRNE